MSDQYTYTDKTTGERIKFTAKADEAMVVFPATTDEHVADDIAGTPSLSISEGINLKLGFAAVHVEDSDDESALTEAVDSSSQITHSLPVMLDENGASRYFIPNQLTVQFNADVADSRARELIAQLGSTIVTVQRTPGYFTVSVPEDGDLFDAIQRFSELPEVAFAEPSEVSFNSELAYIPNDPDFNQLWGLHNTGQTVNGTAGTADADIDAPSAWDISRGHPDVICAVIDTGADMDHDDLAANILPRGSEDWDFANAGDPVPEDEAGSSHGTHVSGTVAAVDDAGGIIGVAPRCRLMPLRVDLTTGMNQNRADAINYVTAQALANPNRRYVVNCSWRMNGDHAGVRTAIRNAVANNVLVVFAAGNANRNTDDNPQFPGVYPEVVSVAALDQRDRRANFSNFGRNVDVAAPGVNIWSTTRNSNHGFLDGTSMASPHVAGLAALVWSRNRCLSNQQVRQIIEDSCDNIDGANRGFEGLLGAGRINARRALQQAQAGPQILQGLYTIQQRSNDRFVDAHEHAGEDFRLVTRPAQGNDTQRWEVETIGLVCTIQQLSNGRFVDAHEHAGEDFRLVTRTAQNNDTQRWVITPVPGRLVTYTIQQLSSGRFVDAHEHAGQDFRLVTRTAQNNDTQRWMLSSIGGCNYTIQQAINGRFVDAHEHGGEDFRLVTRTAQNNDTQRWTLRTVGYLCTIRQRSSGRLVDAHEHSGQDFRLVTRTAQLNDTQRWVATRVGHETYTLQQLSNGRFVDAHEHAGQDFRLVTRTAQNNDTQRWAFRRV